MRIMQGGCMLKPNVSHCINENEVHYNKYIKPFFCKMTLQDNSTIEIEGNGTLTKAMTLPYSADCISVEIGALCTNIGDDTFSGWTTLRDATIFNGVTSIGSRAFRYCSGLATVTIPNTITNIGSSAFFSCSGLTNISIPDSVINIDSVAFKGCRNLTTVTIPDSVTSIGNGVFINCTGLTKVIIGSGVTSIENLFNGCTSITSVGPVGSGSDVELPNSVTNIGSSTFSGCRNLTSVTLPNSVVSIGSTVFTYCSNLTSVTLGNSVESISYQVFGDSNKLMSITSLATTAPTIDSQTFYRIKTNGVLYVPSGSSGYDVWMGTGNYYLGLYNWTKVEQ